MFCGDLRTRLTQHGYRFRHCLRELARAVRLQRLGARLLVSFFVNLVLFLTMLNACHAAAQGNVAPLPIEAALHVRELAPLLPLAFSPDGKWLAYTVHERWISAPSGLQHYLLTGVPPWACGTHIELTNLKTGQSRDLTGSESNNWLPSWSPNGRWLAFLSDRGGGQAQLWIWDRELGVFRRIAPAGMRTDRIAWTRDSNRLVVAAVPATISRGSAVPAAPGGQSPQSHPLVYRSGSLVGRAGFSPPPHAWDLDEYRRELIVLDRRTGEATTLVQERRITGYSIAPDGSAVAYSEPKRFGGPASQQILFDVHVVPLFKNQDRVIASEVPMEYDGQAFSWSPDSSQLAFCTGGMDVAIGDCSVADLRSGTRRNVTNFPAGQPGVSRVSRPLWDAQGRIYFLRDGALWRSGDGERKATMIASVRNRRIVSLISRDGNLLWQTTSGTTLVVTHDDLQKQDGFYTIALATGTVRKRWEEGQCYTCAGLSPPVIVSADGSSIAYAVEDAAHEPDLWTSSASFTTPVQLTHLNPQFDHYALGAARLVRWRDNDGEILHGALLLPPDYRKGQRYPLLVWVYGNGRLSDSVDHFGFGGSGPFDMQLFATRGYAIFWPDAPQRLGRPLADLAQTVLPGINKVIAMGIADPRRLGLIGHSYGGFSVLSLMVQTSRFSAAAEMDGFADLIGVYGEMTRDGSAFGVASMEKGQGLMGASPWQTRERYVENSPIFYLDRISSPLLIINGGEDAAVSPFLGDEIFVGLRRLGKPAEYVKYEGEGHSPLEWSFADQVDLCHRLIAWFGRYFWN